MIEDPGNQSLNAGDLQARKGEHIRLSMDSRAQADESVFDGYRLPYVALPELALQEVDTSYELCGKTLEAPLMIASMTGGTEHGRSINTHLAEAAGMCGIALALGSQRIGLEKEDARETFELVRRLAPNAVIAANMGAVQLNYGHGIDSYRRVIDMAEADILYLHVNPLQEAIQPGGDTDFRGLMRKIERLVSSIETPVFVKEVGNGISGGIARALFDIGVQGVDVAGLGGTSCPWVEAERAGNQDFQRWFKSYGITTDQAIAEAADARASEDQLIVASGGIRSPIDGLKAGALGANIFSAAMPFLVPAIESTAAVVSILDNWKRGLKIGMFASGIGTWDEARKLKLTDSLQPTNQYRSLA